MCVVTCSGEELTVDGYGDDPDDDCNNEDSLIEDHDDSVSAEEHEGLDVHLLKKSMALFYLKLQAKYLLPATTIQHLIDEFDVINSLTTEHMMGILRKSLRLLSLSNDQVEEIILNLSRENWFIKLNESVFKSEKTRSSYFRSQFNYVAPVTQWLEADLVSKKSYQYIPIKESLAALMSSAAVQQDYMSTHSFEGNQASPGVLSDVTDGQVFKRNAFFQENPSALRLILYQDAFEVVNPLGSGKSKHKLLGVYYSLADLEPHNRSNTDHMQLLLLVKDRDFKEFGQCKIFSKLIEDLKSLESEGFATPDGQVYKAGVCGIIGDNLGSHCIGGFSESFSSHYFCRFCRIQKKHFHEDPIKMGSKRTIRHYDESAAAAERDGDMNEGIKFASLFNSLDHYHVFTWSPAMLGA
jgi:hypothetical protein